MSNEHGSPLRELLKLYNAAPDLGTKARRYQDLRAELNTPNLPDLTMLEDTSDAELLAKLSAALGVRPPQEQRKPIPLNSIQENLPQPILLAGAGGVAKSTLALHIALGIAMAPNDGKLHTLHGRKGIFSPLATDTSKHGAIPALFVPVNVSAIRRSTATPFMKLMIW